MRNLPADKKAIDFFELFFTERLYRLIVRETNCYAKREEDRLGKPLGWEQLTIDELQTWLGLYFMMGVVQKPTLHSYWEKNKVTETPDFGKIMSKDRFMNILRFIHLPDDHPDHDRLFKLRPFITKFSANFAGTTFLNRICQLTRRW